MGFISYGGSGVPSGLSSVKAIYSTAYAFAALKEDGTVAVEAVMGGFKGHLLSKCLWP